MFAGSPQAKHILPNFAEHMRTPSVVITIAAVLVLFPACSALRSGQHVDFNTDPKTVLIPNVPFYPQKDLQCGPASLAGVLNYWKVADTPEKIAKAIFIPSVRGTLTIDMLLYVQDKGMDALQYAGSLEDLKLKISNGYPVIVMVDYGFWLYHADHFMVVIGYTDNGVIVNSGKSEKVFIKNNTFLKQWSRANFWTLWIKPK